MLAAGPLWSDILVMCAGLADPCGIIGLQSSALERLLLLATREPECVVLHQATPCCGVSVAVVSEPHVALVMVRLAVIRRCCAAAYR